MSLVSQDESVLVQQLVRVVLVAPLVANPDLEVVVVDWPKLELVLLVEVGEGEDESLLPFVDGGVYLFELAHVGYYGLIDRNHALEHLLLVP